MNFYVYSLSIWEFLLHGWASEAAERVIGDFILLVSIKQVLGESYFGIVAW